MNDKMFFIGVAVLTIGALIFAVLYSTKGNTNTAPISSLSGNTSAGVGASGSVNRDQAPDFSLKDLDGNTVTLSDYRGQKPVILDFFATWCPNCKRDMPKLNKWYEQYKDKVEVIGVNPHPGAHHG